MYLNDHNGFLHHIIDLSLNQLDQSGHALFGRLLNFNGTSANRSHRLSDEIDIDFSCIP